VPGKYCAGVYPRAGSRGERGAGCFGLSVLGKGLDADPEGRFACGTLGLATAGAFSAGAAPALASYGRCDA